MATDDDLVNQYSEFISNEVENGITDYIAWIELVAGGKKGAKKNAKPKRSGTGSDVAEK